MLDQRLVVLLEASEHASLKEIAATRGVSAASLVREAIRQFLDADADPALYCRESSPSYGDDLGEDLVARLRDLAEQQGCSVPEYLSALLDEHETRRARAEALERMRALWESRKGLAAEGGKRTWTREELYER